MNVGTTPCNHVTSSADNRLTTQATIGASNMKKTPDPKKPKLCRERVRFDQGADAGA